MKKRKRGRRWSHCWSTRERASTNCEDVKRSGSAAAGLQTAPQGDFSCFVTFRSVNTNSSIIILSELHATNSDLPTVLNKMHC